MTIEQVYSNLCYYDDRNPDNCLTQDLVEDEVEFKLLRRDCQCDNCFYGRKKLAQYILEILNK